MESRVMMALTAEGVVMVMLIVVACGVAVACRMAAGRDRGALIRLRVAGDMATRAWLDEADAEDVADLKDVLADDAGGLLAVLSGDGAQWILKRRLSTNLAGPLSAYEPLVQTLVDVVLADVMPGERIGAENAKRARAFLEGVAAATDYYGAQ